VNPNLNPTENLAMSDTEERKSGSLSFKSDDDMTSQLDKSEEIKQD